MLTKHATYGKLFWVCIVFTRRAFWDHRQQNLSIFTCLTPVEPTKRPLTFSSITAKRYVIDRSNYTFFWIVIRRGIYWYSFWQHWSNFWIWPLYKLSCDPSLPVQDMNRAAIWNIDPWSHNNIIRLSNFLFLFSWVILLASGLDRDY